MNGRFDQPNPITFKTDDPSISEYYPKAVATCAFRNDSMRREIATVKIRSGQIQLTEEGDIERDIAITKEAVQ